MTHHEGSHSSPISASGEASLPSPGLFCQALGQAVVKMWSHLPPELQHDLFEGVIVARGESIRPQLAVFLHGEHPRTSASIKARAMLEPDSLGG